MCVGEETATVIAKKPQVVVDSYMLMSTFSVVEICMEYIQLKKINPLIGVYWCLFFLNTWIVNNVYINHSTCHILMSYYIINYNIIIPVNGRQMKLTFRTQCIMINLVFSMIGTLFPLPRILYSMASDGLLFHIFSKVDSKTKTPFWGTLICGAFAGKLRVRIKCIHNIDVYYAICYNDILL